MHADIFPKIPVIAMLKCSAARKNGLPISARILNLSIYLSKILYLPIKAIRFIILLFTNLRSLWLPTSNACRHFLQDPGCCYVGMFRCAPDGPPISARGLWGRLITWAREHRVGHGTCCARSALPSGMPSAPSCSTLSSTWRLVRGVTLCEEKNNNSV